MYAVVYHGPGQKSWDQVPDPGINDDTDAIVRVDSTTICGTDLHILKGDVPEMTPGRILGHEAVGTIVEIRPNRRRRFDPAVDADEVRPGHCAIPVRRDCRPAAALWRPWMVMNCSAALSRLPAPHLGVVGQQALPTCSNRWE